MTDRKYLPMLAELIDRLSIVQLKEIYIAEHAEEYRTERALIEYEKLAAVYPAERQGLMAQLGAARILLKRLDRPHDALRLYEAASASAVPHLDCERDIQSGIKEAEAALSQKVSV